MNKKPNTMSKRVSFSLLINANDSIITAAMNDAIKDIYTAIFRGDEVLTTVTNF